VASNNPLSRLGRTLGRRWDAVLAVIAVGAAAVYFSPNLLGGNPSKGPDVVTGTGGNTYQTQAQPSGPAARSTASADPAGPFAYTPAATWAEGAAGIAIPEASDVDGFAAADVAAALGQVKAALIATRLDHRMLIDHDPSAFLDLVAPATRDTLDGLVRGTTLGTLQLVTRIDPRAHLGRNPPRVSGRTSLSGVTDDQHRAVLDIVTNYVWAYAFDTDDVVVVHDEVTWRFYRTGDVRADAHGLWAVQTGGYVMGVDCAAADRGLLAPPTRTIQASPGATPENPGNLFDPDHVLDITSTC
jgi:hypothetical protein